MKPALQPYEPLNVLKPVHEGLALVDGPEVRMAVPGGSVPFTTRMTVVRLDGGGLWLHSPIAPDEGLFSALDALGPVRHLVSPNRIHYAHIAAWKQRYPEATAWASPGVRERAAEQGIPVRFDADLEDAPPPDWAGQLDQLIFKGSRALEEVVFFHRASSTLVLADLIENFERERVAPRWRWLLRVGGVMAPHGGTPRDLAASFLGRRDQARACFARMRAWAPERVVIAHGAWFPEGGVEVLDRAFWWVGQP